MTMATKRIRGELSQMMQAMFLINTHDKQYVLLRMMEKRRNSL